MANIMHTIDAIHDSVMTKSKVPSLNVLGIPISAVTLPRAAELIAELAQQGNSSTVAIAAVHSVIDAQDDPGAKKAMREAALCVPDGVPLVWLLRLCGYKNVSQVCGTDLMLELSRVMAAKGLSAYYFGGQPGVAETLAARLAHDYPGLRTAGVHSPPFKDMDEDEKTRIADMINQANADIVWIGLGAPKQERWMNEFRPRLTAPVLIGAGAAFDFNTGRMTRAPRWMQKCALEWVYRLVKEPRRLWRRYLRNNPLFLWYVFCQCTRLKSFD